MTGSYPLSLTADAQGDHFHAEFFGLPGSGKTTIAREVHKLLSRDHPELLFAPDLLCDEARVTQRLAAKLRLILSDFGGVNGLGTIRQAFAIRQAHRRDKLRAVFTVATVASLNTRIRRRRLDAVLDQGSLQALWSVQLRAGGAGTGALVQRMLRDAAGSGRVHIAVETPPEVCNKRLNARISKHSRLQQAGAGADDAGWQTAELLRRTILRHLRVAYRHQGIEPRIIVVDGTPDAADVARQIVASLRQSNSLNVLHPVSDVRGMIA